MAIAGRVAMIPKGDYDSATTYQILDVVRYNDASYVAKKSSTGILPTDTEYWMLMTQDGLLVDDSFSETSERPVQNKVVNEAIQNIINGTTPAGDSKKFGGKGAGEYLTRTLDFMITADEDIIETALSTERCPLYQVTRFRAYQSTSGPHIGDFWITVEKIEINTYMRVTAESITTTETWVNSLVSGSWSGWQRANDGGNADTVGGYHASEWFLHPVNETAQYSKIASLPNGHWAIYDAANRHTDYPVSLTNQGLIYGVVSISTTIGNAGYKVGTIIATNASASVVRTVDFFTNNNDELTLVEHLPLTGGIVTGSIGIKASAPYLHVMNTTVNRTNRLGVASNKAVAYCNVDNDNGANSVLLLLGSETFNVNDLLKLNVNKSGETSANYTVLHSGNISEHALPIGGGTVKGAIKATGGVFVPRSIDDMAYDVFLGVSNNGRGGLYHRTNEVNDAVVYLSPTELSYQPRVDGVTTNYPIHHDGNSAKVVQATSAPSDTTAVWVDTANKVTKIYKDGAWTALA